MEFTAAAAHGDDRRIFQQFLGHFGGPAFARRARDVQMAYDSVVECCRRQREEWLAFVRLRLGELFALAGAPAALEPILASAERLTRLEELYVELQPRLRGPPAPTRSTRVLRAALTDLKGSIERFNQRWLTFVQNLDLEKLNALRDGYNRFYLMEKECALGSARIARQGFHKLEPLAPEHFLKVFPLLPAP